MDLREFRKIKFKKGMAFMAADGRTRELLVDTNGVFIKR